MTQNVEIDCQNCEIKINYDKEIQLWIHNWFLFHNLDFSYEV